jgi:hypothetical protein
MSFQPFRTITLVGAMALIASTAMAANDARLPNGKSMYGVPVAAGAATKEVNVATTGYVNVSCGDVVVFRNADKTFAWKFDVIGHRGVDLQSIAPAGFANKPLRIHVATNDMERS